MSSAPHSLLVTGGAGYIGGSLVPRLLDDGHTVTVLDALYFGDQHLAPLRGNPRLKVVRGDIRDADGVRALLARGGFDTVIHLAAIANDPCAELDAELTKAVNLDAVVSLMAAAKGAGVRRFLYASSASVYGIKSDPDVHEGLSLEPITLYARYKAEGEAFLRSITDASFCGVSVRAATVCGYAPRLRLDLTVNLLTHQALTKGEIRVFGGTQSRPNIHVDDLAELYRLLVTADAARICGEAFNVSAENATVAALAECIRGVIDPALPIVTVPTEDNRSYALSARKLTERLGFTPTHTVVDAVRGLRDAYQAGRVPNADGSVYRNVAHMRATADDWRSPRAVERP